MMVSNSINSLIFISKRKEIDPHTTVNPQSRKRSVEHQLIRKRMAQLFPNQNNWRFIFWLNDNHFRVIYSIRNLHFHHRRIPLLLSNTYDPFHFVIFFRFLQFLLPFRLSIEIFVVRLSIESVIRFRIKTAAKMTLICRWRQKWMWSRPFVITYYLSNFRIDFYNLFTWKLETTNKSSFCEKPSDQNLYKEPHSETHRNNKLAHVGSMRRFICRMSKLASYYLCDATVCSGVFSH